MAQPHSHVASAGQTRSRDVPGDDREVALFFERFRNAMTSGDTRKMTTLWDVPAYVVHEEMARAVGSSAEVEQFFAGAKEAYEDRGIVDTRPDFEGIEWLGPRLVLAHVRWPYYDGEGRERGEERSTYVLRRGGDGALRLCVAVMLGASEPDAGRA